MDLRIIINGKECVSEVESRTLLVDHLRDSAKLTGTKVGCNHVILLKYYSKNQ